MDLLAACTDLGIALGLGLLVGLQREKAESAIAGIRTFALITVFGAMMALTGRVFEGQAWAGPAFISAGALCVLGLAFIGNMSRGTQKEPLGVTTEVAMLVMYACGALCGSGENAVAAIIGATTVVLLHVKPVLHRFTAALTENDLRAVMQFAVISLIILPIVPDRDMGPFGAINPRHLWLMVVLVVGISLGAYVAFRVLGDKQGMLWAGLLAGLISSTAATVSFSRRVKEQPAAAAVAAFAIMLASTVVYARVLVELYAVARHKFMLVCWPIAALLALSVGLCVVARFLMNHSKRVAIPVTKNPSEFKLALVFAGLLAAVQVASAAANHWFGGKGLFAVTAVTGLLDMDAITLSSGRLLAQGQTSARDAAMAVVMALLSNTIFKLCVAGVLGGGALLKRLWWMYAINAAACVVVMVVWLPGMEGAVEAPETP